MSKTLKISLFLDSEGAERIAKGETLIYWDISVRTWDTDYGGNQVRPEPPRGCVETPLVDGIEFTLPDPAVAIKIAVDAIGARIKEKMADYQMDMQDLQQRKNDLLMIGYSA